IALLDRYSAIAHCGSGPRRDRPASSSRVAPLSEGRCRILTLPDGPDKLHLCFNRKSWGFLPRVDEGLQSLSVLSSGRQTGRSLHEICYATHLSWTAY